MIPVTANDAAVLRAACDEHCIFTASLANFMFCAVYLPIFFLGRIWKNARFKFSVSLFG